MHQLLFDGSIGQGKRDNNNPAELLKKIFYLLENCVFRICNVH